MKKQGVLCVKQETEVMGAEMDGDLASDLHHDHHLSASMLRLTFLPGI